MSRQPDHKQAQLARVRDAATSIGRGSLRIFLSLIDWYFSLAWPSGAGWRRYDSAWRRRWLRERRAYEYLRRLEQRGWIERRGRGRTGEIRITPEGTRRIKRLLADQAQLPRGGPWDGRWHVIVFDVPEAHRLGRDLLRRKLYALGCLPLQKSVFAYPYPYRDVVEVIREAYDLRTDLYYMVVTDIDRRDELVARFTQRGILPDSAV